MKGYIIDESPCYPGKCRICLGEGEYGFKTMKKGSYNVLAARILGLEWTDYLRYCRDEWDAEIVGKNTIYPVAYFPNDKKPYGLVKILNDRLNKICKKNNFVV